MTVLDERIEVIRKQYGLRDDDFWQIPQNKQWVCKHKALEIVAVKAGIVFDPPMIIEADSKNLTVCMAVTGRMEVLKGERVEWSTGETNPTNYHVSGKQPGYPWAMAEKRAKDRVILKLVGIHGLVYSEDEISKDSGTKPASSAHMKKKLMEIENELLDCALIADVDKYAREWRDIMAEEHWSQTYKDEAKPKFELRRIAINEAMNRSPEESLENQFPDTDEGPES